MHPKGRIQKQKQQVQVDLKQADTIKCSECNNYLFITSFVLKRLSALVSPNGQEALIPVQVYSCGNCGKVAEGMLDGAGAQVIKDSNCGFYGSAGDFKALHQNIMKAYNEDSSSLTQKGLNGKYFYDENFSKKRVINTLIKIFNY